MITTEKALVDIYSPPGVSMYTYAPELRGLRTRLPCFLFFFFFFWQTVYGPLKVKKFFNCPFFGDDLSVLTKSYCLISGTQDERVPVFPFR